MTAITEHGVVVWNKAVGKYELTTLGHQRLEEYRHQFASRV